MISTLNLELGGEFAWLAGVGGPLMAVFTPDLSAPPLSYPTICLFLTTQALSRKEAQLMDRYQHRLGTGRPRSTYRNTGRFWPIKCVRPVRGTALSTIFFVEDAPAWRAVFGEFLRNEGFTGPEGSEFTEPVDACREFPEPVDLDIIGITGGVHLARHLAQRYPHMGLVFVGDSRDISVQPLPRPKYTYLRKPFTIETLLQSIQDLIPSGVAA